MKSAPPKIVILVCVCILLVHGAAAQETGSPTSPIILDYTPIICRTTASTVASGINNSGTIVGYCYVEPPRGFELTGSSLQYIWFPGAIITQAFGVNNLGVIVGTFWDLSFQEHGFTLDNGVFSQFDAPGSTATFGMGINDNGDIVGYYTATGDIVQGYLLQNGTFTDLTFPGSSSTFPNGINNAGDVVGIYWNPDEHGFWLHAGSYSTLDYAGSNSTYPFGINNLGQIVGAFGYGTYFGRGAGFMYSNGTFLPFRLKGFEPLTPDADQRMGINDLGQIVGTYYINPKRGTSRSRGFMAQLPAQH